MSALAAALAAFEADPDHPRYGPFRESAVSDAADRILPVTEAFLDGGAVPATASWLEPGHDPEAAHAVAYATAGLLQGLAIGYALGAGAR